MGKAKTFLLYAAYTIVILVICLYIRFPSEKIGSYLAFRLGRMAPDISLSIADAKPSFPPGIRLDRLVISSAEADKLLEIDYTKVSPALLSLAEDQTRYRFKGTMLSGHFSGTAAIGDESDNRSLQIEAEFSGLQISELPALLAYAKRRIAGSLEGSIIHANTGSAGSTQIRILLTDGSLELLAPIPEMNRIPFETIEIELSITKDRVQVRKCAMSGGYVEGDLKGMVRLRTPLQNSTINLRGRIKPQAEIISALRENLPPALLPKRLTDQNGFPITLDGTLENPGFKLR